MLLTVAWATAANAQKVSTPDATRDNVGEMATEANRAPKGDAVILWGARGWGCSISTPPGWIIDDQAAPGIAEAGIREAGNKTSDLQIMLYSRPALREGKKRLALSTFLKRGREDFVAANPLVEITDDTFTTHGGDRAVVVRYTASKDPHRIADVWLDDESGYVSFRLTAPDQASFDRAYLVLRHVVESYVRLDVRQGKPPKHAHKKS